jgi:hypothetical protein
VVVTRTIGGSINESCEDVFPCRLMSSRARGGYYAVVQAASSSASFGYLFEAERIDTQAA